MIRKRIKDKEYELVTTDFNIHDCHACVFGNNGSCSLVEIYTMCKSTNRTHWEEIKDNNTDMKKTYKAKDCANYKVVKPIKANCSDGNSSTGVVNPSIDDTPKEPKGLDKYTTRRFTKEVTLEEARNWYNSHNELLRDFATRIFTPAELEDVRICSCPIDIETAKRLYRNAENTVRQFVLSAFSEEELKD